MRLILKPLDDSNDLVAICDRHGTMCGAVHVDTFLTGIRGGEIYARLWNGETVSVVLELAGSDEPGDAGCVAGGCGETGQGVAKIPGGIRG
jgi:hypothetical protein